jgi:hypothetical protein
MRHSRSVSGVDRQGSQELNEVVNVDPRDPSAFVVRYKGAVRYFERPYLRYNDIGLFDILKDGAAVGRRFGWIVRKAPREGYGCIENERIHLNAVAFM